MKIKPSYLWMVTKHPEYFNTLLKKKEKVPEYDIYAEIERAFIMQNTSDVRKQWHEKARVIEALPDDHLLIHIKNGEIMKLDSMVLDDEIKERQ